MSGRRTSHHRLVVWSRTLALVALLAVLAASCTRPFERAVEALSPSTPPGSTGPSPGADPTAPTRTRPPIVVRTPAPGEEVTSPVRIAGTADVFEATVSVRVLGEDGMELAATFTTATCGSGCRGRFSTELFFVVDHRQPGTIEVFGASAEDGLPLGLVTIPVTLVPGR